MPDYHFCLSRCSSPQSQPKYYIIEPQDSLTSSTNSLVDRILGRLPPSQPCPVHTILTKLSADNGKLLSPAKHTSTSIYLDHLGFHHDEHSYKAMLLSRDTKLGERKVIVEGEFKWSSSKGEAKKKALEDLLRKSAEKVKEEMDKLRKCGFCGK